DPGRSGRRPADGLRPCQRRRRARPLRPLPGCRPALRDPPPALTRPPVPPAARPPTARRSGRRRRRPPEAHVPEPQKEAAMPRMRAVDAAVAILAKEGATQAFGLPGAAINPFYSAVRDHGGIRHVLARHVEGASHMADGYSRTRPGNIGICIGTSGPAGTDMITGLYAAWADSVPM